jgi:hypothetical protein
MMLNRLPREAKPIEETAAAATSNNVYTYVRRLPPLESRDEISTAMQYAPVHFQRNRCVSMRSRDMVASLNLKEEHDVQKSDLRKSPCVAPEPDR